MKAIKFIAIGALMLGLSAPVSAQVDAQAAIDQVEAILNSQAPDADKQINKVAGKFKKDAMTLTEIGKLYMYAKKYDKALEYAEKACTASKNKCAAAFVLKGDLAALNDAGGEAAMWYQNAQVCDPKYPEGYIRYAYLMRKSGLNASLEVLQTLKQNVPDYDINVTAAKICKDVDNKAKEFEYYAKADLSKMKDADLLEYAMDLYFDKQYEKSLQVAKTGVQRFDKNQPLVRMVFFNNTKLKNFNEALTWADKLFALDSMTPTTLDYQTLAEAQEGAEKFDQAIDTYNKLYEMEGVSDAQKTFALKSIAFIYNQQKDYANAVTAYKNFINNATGVTSADYKRLIMVQQNYALTLEGDAKTAVLNEILESVDDLDKKYDDSKVFCLYQRAVVGISTENSEMSLKAYDEMITYIKANGLAEKNADMLVSAYTYNLIYYLQAGEDIPKAKEYAALLAEIDPNNELAQKVLAIE